MFITSVFCQVRQIQSKQQSKEKFQNFTPLLFIYTTFNSFFFIFTNKIIFIKIFLVKYNALTLCKAC